MAEKRMLAPNTTIWALLTSAVANPLAPTVAEINAGKNISCAIVEGYTLNATDSATDDTRSICDAGNVEQYTGDNYEGELTFFRDDDLTDVASVYNIAVTMFAVPVNVILVKRIGKKATLVAVSGDVVSSYSFESDYPQEQDGGVEAPHQVLVPFLPDGSMTLNRTLA